ncbi:MAG: MtrB/PioB family decaheme-associated outer membrane protein [Chromatiales bacterium]|nr:MtrB/PioB family decaheme-associated outer membrane protein [Chromatiales bacterium]
MKTNKQTWVLTAISAAIATVLATSVQAEGGLDFKGSSVSVGVGHWSGEREQFGMFDGIRDDETILLLDADLRGRDLSNGSWLTGKVRDLGIDSREFDIHYQQQGRFGLGLSYDRIVRNAPWTVNTGMAGFGTTEQMVPDSADGYVPGTGADRHIGTDREKIGLDGFYYITPQFNIKIDFKNEEKDGTRHWGRGGQPEFAVEPIDSTIKQVEATLNYVGDQLQLSGGYYGSWYDNDHDLVTSYRGIMSPGSEYYLSLPMSNEAHQVFLNGGFSVTPTTRATFRASYTHATQDEHLPTADIPGLADPIAPSSLDGELDTTQLYFGLTARPLPMLHLAASVNYHRVNEKTPEWLVVTTGSGVHSTPLDYETLTGKVEGTYTFGHGLSLIAGVDYREQDRTVPFGADGDMDGLDDERYVPWRADIDETTYRIQLRKAMSETINGSIAYLHSKRDGSDYAPAVHSEGVAGSGINPINIADRDRDKIRGTVNWTPTENLGLQFTAEHSQDDYGPGSNRYGLSEGTANFYSVDADFAINADWHVTAWAAYDRTEADQFNGSWDRVTENHELDRDSTLRDTGTSVGLGIEGKPMGRLKVGANASYTRTKSEYNDTVIPIGENGDPDTDYNAASGGPLDDVVNKATILNAFAEYSLSKSSLVRVDVIHERWRTNDWSWQFADGSPFTYGTTNDGTTVLQDPKQSATFVGVRYKHMFE